MQPKLGILGGGQLGLMTAQAAQRQGYRTVIYGEPQADNVAFAAADCKIVGHFTARQTLEAFARALDGAPATLEFENVPVESVEYLCKLGVPVRPGPHVLRVAQHRWCEKECARDLDIPTTAYQLVGPIRLIPPEEAAQLLPGIIKTARMGYDGHGQRRVDTYDELNEALFEMGAKELLVERVVDFAYELSVIVARNERGDLRTLPPTINWHESGILREVVYDPNQVPREVEATAKHAAMRLARHLKVVGLLAVEFFVTKNGTVLFNEMAPRPHNSGHWSIEGCRTSQFDLAVQAAVGLPLGPTGATVKFARMRNLLGQEIAEAEVYKAQGGIVHCYGKKDAKPRRKMGHVTFVERLKEPV